MNSKRIMKYMIVFNVIMGLFIFLSSELLLILLNGRIIQEVNIFIDFRYPYTFPAIPTVYAPFPNYPFFVFLFTSIVNAIFLLWPHRSKE
jgi:hypothetical protein